MSTLTRRTAALAAKCPSLRADLREALKSATTQVKNAVLDTRTLDQLVEMAADSFGYDTSGVYATRQVEQAAAKFTKAVAKALSLWTQKNPPKGGATVSDLMRAGGAYAVFMTLEGHGVGIWDGRWGRFYDDTTKLERFLERAVTREYDALTNAIRDAAFETGGGQ